MTTQDLTTMTVAALWEALLAARDADDHGTVRTIEQRMRALQGPTRFAALSDDELDARIAAIDGNRAPTGLLAYSPGGNDGMDAGIADLPRMNRAIVAQQHVGLEAQRTHLLDERDRRRGVLGRGPGASTPAPPEGRSIWRRVLAFFVGGSPEEGRAEQAARDHAALGRARGAVEHGRHHGGGHHGAIGGGGL